MIIILFALFVINSAIANTNFIDHWETVIYSNDIWKYHPGFTEPGAGWNTFSFNDSSWLQGPGGIGYGDGDDNTTIGQTVSLFLRIKFNIILCVLVTYSNIFVSIVKNYFGERDGKA